MLPRGGLIFCRSDIMIYRPVRARSRNDGRPNLPTPSFSRGVIHQQPALLGVWRTIVSPALVQPVGDAASLITNATTSSAGRPAADTLPSPLYAS